LSNPPLLAAVDIGSTNVKAGFFRLDGSPAALASRPMPLRRSADGSAAFDPDQVWRLVCDALLEVIAAATSVDVRALGVVSMAESGLLIDAETGSPRSQLIPWFDTGAAPDAARLAAESDGFARFRATGLRMNYKAGAAKVASVVRQRGRAALHSARWLSAADYIAYRLCAAMRTDPTLAARTHAFSLESGAWDRAWLEAVGLPRDLFAPVARSGETIGRVTEQAAAQCGLPAGLPVAIAGHDHVVAALAVDALGVGLHGGRRALDSMGTAESLVGSMPARCLTEADYASGLTFGPVPETGEGVSPSPHVPQANGSAARLHWMGALSASGGSIEWLRTMLADPHVSYEHLLNLLSRAEPGPSPILYFPYLAGAQAPEPDPAARGAFVGLTARHTASDLALAVIQGAAYEMERVRQAAERLTGAIDELTVVGGGARIRRWLQIKADVAGRPVTVAPREEAALLGAALLAGAGAGVYDSLPAAVDAANAERGPAIEPDMVDHRAHRRLLDGPYAALQGPIRQASVALAAALREDEALA
jgi:sugar (pentulose or hexulose) kinase